MVRQTRRGRDDTTVRQGRPGCAGPYRFARPLLSLALVAVIGSVVLAGVGVAPASAAPQSDGATACQLDRASPQAVVDLRERAQQRLGELQRLKTDSTVPVDQATIDTVANRLQNGNISYDRARYRRACSHYQIALDQSDAALERLYTTLAEIRLASVEDYIATRRAAGYDSMAMANLSARHEALATQTANVSSLSQARAVATESGELEADTEAQLPPTHTVQAANAISPLWSSVPIGAGLVLILGGTGGLLGRLTADTAESNEDTEDTTDVEPRGPRFDGDTGT